MTKNVYERNVNTVLDAYNSGTLFHGKCNACALGNILHSDKWAYEFYTEREGGSKIERNKNPNIDYIYESSGMNRIECMKIEHAFESAIHKTKEGYDYWINPNNEKQGQYKGLCAVLAVMETMVEEDVHHQAEDALYRLQGIAEKYGVTV